MMTAELELNAPAVQARIQRKLGSVQHDLDQRILRDANYFAPMDVGTLIDSSYLHSEIGQGLLVWATPYARPQYYGLPNKSKDKNPRAQMKWFEAAQSRYGKEWIEVANEKYSS